MDPSPTALDSQGDTAMFFLIYSFALKIEAAFVYIFGWCATAGPALQTRMSVTD
uniref:Uncharacterized protein n=1 Tax=Anguilla anguilla TaxID=7936 RepID=A0A0E9QQ35_ANGAN